MSQLRQTASVSIGQLQPSIKLAWSDFVQVVLEVTIEAYRVMRQEQVTERGWEENVFTLRLGYDYIRPIAFDRNLPLRVSVRTKTHTEAMRMGKQKTNEAKEIDLQIFDIGEKEHHKKHFVWEAKRVGDKRIDSGYSGLNSKYVNEAIYRFIEQEYADGLNDAGVLGYILAGEVATIVGDINQSMGRINENPPLSVSNHLCLAQSIADFKDIYRSNHTRTDHTNIQLHHLFLTFDFDQ